MGNFYSKTPSDESLPIPPPKPTSFTKFHYLPLEIQHTIWYFACEDYAIKHSRRLRVAKDPLGKQKVLADGQLRIIASRGFQPLASYTFVNPPEHSH
ncbi:uncharacterized protein PAC_11156 [Phialocephala subalpina]|uniref:2EXR domain-containing protein n=1 Tax=Phialocephala subalpina TaxID=576137 RepID=A0A1L7X8A9_9HELO|nr:uncharacterized protein PAC_11156 [Phialocephala subalpina]